MRLGNDKKPEVTIENFVLQTDTLKNGVLEVSWLG